MFLEYFQDSPRLGPMDLHLLSVVGTKMPIHECRNSQLQLVGACSEASGQNLNKTDSDSEIWPISESMLRTLAIK